MTKQKLKIALVGDCLAAGGAEKIHALLSIYFTKQGFDVHNCIFTDWISYDFGGKMTNLGEIKSQSSVQKKIKKLIAFKKFIAKNNFDICIDFRMRNEFFKDFLFSKFIYPKQTIYTVHSGILNFYFPNNRLISQILYKNKNVVSVSKAIQKLILEKEYANCVQTIYNPVVIEDLVRNANPMRQIDCQYVLAVGRMNTDVKQFDKLIQSYSKTILPTRHIKLVIVGDGSLKNDYCKIVENLKIQSNVIFIGFQKNLVPIYKNAIFTILCSKNEGLPNVLLESLACKTPIIAFDCFTGPSEIVRNNENGILVENQNFQALETAMDFMIENKEFYLNCKHNSLPSIANFQLEKIGLDWLNYFSEIHLTASK